MKRTFRQSFVFIAILMALILPSAVLAQTTVQSTPAAPVTASSSGTPIRVRHGLKLYNPTAAPIILQPTQTPYVIVVTATPQVPQYNPAPVYAPEKPFDCAVNVNSPYYYQQFAPGEDFDFDVTFTNTGTQTWTTDIDVQQYSGWQMEIEGKYTYDIDKDYGSAVFVAPGQSIRWKIRMEAPKDNSNEKGLYYSTYYLVNGTYRNADYPAVTDVPKYNFDRLFCPFSVYVYVPHRND